MLPSNKALEIHSLEQFQLLVRELHIVSVKNIIINGRNYFQRLFQYY